MNSENYLRWANQTKHKPLTRTQHLFVEFCLDNHKELSVIGSLEDVFADVRKFIKHSGNFLVEEVKKELPQVPIVEVDNEWSEWNWDDVEVEVEEKFDWSLPMKVIHEKYNPNKAVISKSKRTFKQSFSATKTYPVKQETVPLFDFEKDLYNEKSVSYEVFIMFPKKAKYKRKCLCIGQLKTDNNFVYYDSLDDRYIVKEKDGSYITYTTSALLNLITYNLVQPNGYKKTLTEFVNEYISQEESPNFHYED